MPNPRLYGFRYLCPETGSNYQRPMPLRVASGYAVALNVGDPVELTAAGDVILSPAGSVVLSMMGVIVGIGPYWDGTKMTVGNRLPANTTPGAANIERESIVYVMPAAHNLFECCTSTAPGTRAACITLVGMNLDHVNTAVPPLNWPELNIASALNTTAQWRVVDLPRSTVDVDWAALYVPLIVSGNEIATPPATPLVGI